jgi:Alkaline phosphatase PhoX
MSRISRKGAGIAAGIGAVGAGIAAAAGLAWPSGLGLSPVSAPQDKAPGFVRANLLSPELIETRVAEGALKLDDGTAAVPYYGYLGNGPHVPAYGDVQSTTHNVEAQKTEPDKNTYLVLRGLHGADPGYDYGRHFLFQGHEAGSPGALTRVNLDADGPHRVTLLATQTVDGKSLPTIDGSTWDPWARRILLTAESAAPAGGVWQATPDYPSRVENLQAQLGSGGYEGIQNDDLGNLYIAEDVGGKNGSTAAGISHARQPNSFLYRFLPADRSDLTAGGQLQALQLLDEEGNPITFGGTKQDQIDADIQSPANRDLRTYGKTFRTHWIDLSLSAPAHDANAAAKAAGATPFKRPENLQFRPGSGFTQLFFDETGDTTKLDPAEAAKDPGAYGSIFRLRQDPHSDWGRISLFYAGDVEHAAFDNVAFLTRTLVSFVEDRGDGFHAAANALDSGWVFDVRRDYSDASNQPLRWLAEGRDPSATIDSGLLGQPGFNNDGDNEITGIHVSDGDPSPGGILGAKSPTPFKDGWRWFWTQQHGDNVTWEVLAAGQDSGHRAWPGGYGR